MAPLVADQVARANRVAAVHRAFKRLVSPNSRLIVGRFCFFTGQRPPGDADTTMLVDAGRADLLWIVLAATTPEARVYGAIGLRDAGAISPADYLYFVNAIQEPVETCRGCNVRSTNAAEAASNYDEDADLGLRPIISM